MTNPRLFLSLAAVAVLLAACAPATSTAASAQPAPILPMLTVQPPAPTQDTPVQTASAAAPTARPVATSRGPNLEATDPTTVNLASGGLQLVEFFEFW